MVAAVVVVVLHSGSSSRDTSGIASPHSPQLAPNAPPSPPQTLATVSGLSLEVPVSDGRITAIVYHATGATNAIPLSPAGTQKNAGFLARLGNRLFGSGGGGGPSYYIDSSGDGPDTGSVDVGAPAGTDVYSPVDGTIVAIDDVVLNAAAYGSRIDIQPTGAPSLVVSVSHVRVDPSLVIGSPVTAGSSKLGAVVDFAHAERQALARYTNDSGNHVVIEVHPSATLALG